LPRVQGAADKPHADHGANATANIQTDVARARWLARALRVRPRRFSTPSTRTRRGLSPRCTPIGLAGAPARPRARTGLCFETLRENDRVSGKRLVAVAFLTTFTASCGDDTPERREPAVLRVHQTCLPRPEGPADCAIAAQQVCLARGYSSGAPLEQESGRLCKLSGVERNCKIKTWLSVAACK